MCVCVCVCVRVRARVCEATISLNCIKIYMGVFSCYYIHFRTSTLEKGMNPFILPTMGYIVPLLSRKDGFGIK